MAARSDRHPRKFRLGYLALLFMLILSPFSNQVLAGMGQTVTSKFLSRTLGIKRPKLKAAFVYSPGYPVMNQSVQFTDTSTGGASSWQWDFGDGATSTIQNPVHSYSAVGFYKVALVVANSAGSKSVKRTVTVMPSSSLSVSFSYYPGYPTLGDAVQFTDQSTGEPTSWEWDFGDGTSSISPNPDNTYAGAGFYQVTLTATNSTGSKSARRTITVMSGTGPVASFNYRPGSPAPGQILQFTDTSTGSPTSWQWSFGDGATSTAQNPTHTYATAGSKTVTLTVTNSVGSNTTTQTIPVAATIAASFVYTPSSPTTGQSVQFTDTSSGSPTSWQWSFGDGATSTSRNPDHSYATPGSYTVTLTAANSSGSASANRTVTVVSDSSLAASFNYSPSSPVAGQTVQFTDTSTGSPLAWQWSFGDGAVSTAQSPSHTYVTVGSYTVTLTVTNNTSSTSTSRTISVTSTLSASFNFTPSYPNPAQPVQFTDASTGNPTSWQWNFGDGVTSTSRDPSHAYATAGTYLVTLTVADGFGSDTASRTITLMTTIDPIPADRLYDWSYAGVPGSIPNRATIYQSLGVAGQSPSYAQGVTSTQINTALTNCPNGQVVYLHPGTYTVGQISFASLVGKTLRGAGAGQTVLVLTSSIVNAERIYDESSGITVVSGYTKGSMSITLASAPTANFRAGNLIAISEDASPNKWGAGIGTYYRTGLSSGSTLYNLSQIRVFRHMNRIVSVSGNTINLAVPIPLDFSPSLNIRAYPPRATGCTSLCGIENFTIDANNTVGTPIRFTAADRCWFKNIELKNVPGSDIGMIRLWACFQCEIRRCYIHDATGYPSQADGYATSFNYGSSNCRIEDCIVWRVADLCETNGAAGNVYLYNYAREINRNNSYGRGITLNHGPHGFMNLAEGNIVPNVCNDGYHGSASHIVMFRNHLNGDNMVQQKIVNICRGSYYQTLVGNVLGDSSWTPTHYERPADGLGTSAIYFLGFPAADSTSVPHTGVPLLAHYSKYYGNILDEGGQYIDPDVARTLLRHGNYDYYNNAVVWDYDIASHTIPVSLVYGSKPDYFGSLQWPPIGPDVSGLVRDIPAKARWDAYISSGNLADLF